MRLREKPSSDVNQDFATPVSKPGARLDRISAANIPCIKKGFRASITGAWFARFESGLSSGIGDIERAKVRVRRS